MSQIVLPSEYPTAKGLPLLAPIIKFGKFLKIIPKAKLPLSFFKVSKTASSGSRVFNDSVINKVMTSVSVCDLNFNPLFSKAFFNSSEFSIIPLCTTETTSEECGCALISLGIPCVAHPACPIPILPSEGCLIISALTHQLCLNIFSH